MRFGYGPFRGETGEFQLRSFTTVGQRNNGVLEKVVRTLSVEFEIVREGQAAISARFAQIAAAIKRDGFDVGFYEDSGARSQIFIPSRETSSGVQITEWPSLTYGDGADYATHHKGSCSFQAEYLPIAFGATAGQQNQSQLSSYREQVSVRGTGGPRYAVDVTDRGQPRRFVLADRTPIFAQQSGSLEVVSNAPFFPAPNPPLWPQILDGETAEHAKGIEPLNDGGYRCTVGWNYTFQSAQKLFGEPRAR